MKKEKGLKMIYAFAETGNDGFYRNGEIVTSLKTSPTDASLVFPEMKNKISEIIQSIINRRVWVYARSDRSGRKLSGKTSVYVEIQRGSEKVIANVSDILKVMYNNLEGDKDNFIDRVKSDLSGIKIKGYISAKEYDVEYAVKEVRLQFS